MDRDLLLDLTGRQAGVVARRQLREAGASPADLRRWLRARRLVTVYPGIYLTHTGPPSWQARAWAAVLVLWPAALCHRSALGPGGEPVHVAVPRGRTPVARAGVVTHWLTGLEERVQWHLEPPRIRFEDAVLQVASSAPTPDAALEVVAAACRERRTTPRRLASELALHPSLPRRRLLLAVVSEVEQGVHSTLESAYVRQVERAHGLPQGSRQVREETGLGVVYRDVEYAALGLVVELDGRIGHERGVDRGDDLDRDLVLASTDRTVIRLGWRQAMLDPCRTAALLGAVMAHRGWRGRVRPCGRPGCTAMLPMSDAG